MSLEEAARQARRRVLAMVHRSGSSHVGAALSLVEILVALYHEVLRSDPSRPDAPGRDRLVLSKAHGSAALYAVLAGRGFFPESRLLEYYSDGGSLPGHLDAASAPGIEFSAGSLGHGLGAALGMAVAGKKSGFGAFAVLGDGECNEGSVWEWPGTELLGSLTPRPSRCHVYDHLQHAKTEGEGLLHLIM